MSYILDALRKSERERRPGVTNTRDPGPAPLPPRPIVAYAVPILAVAVVAAGIYLIVARPTADSAGAAAAVAKANPVENIPNPKDVRPPSPSEPTAKTEPPPAPAPRTEAPKATPPASKSGQAGSQRVRNLAEQTRIPPPRPQAPEQRLPGTVISAAAPPPRAAPVNDGIKLLRAMPADFQRSLPELVVNIHVYGPNAAERILYINNREYHAGDKVHDGIVVEQIVEDGAVLSFRGQRFKLPRPS